MTDSSERKKELRKSTKEKISKLSAAYCENADKMILHNVTALKEYQMAKVVFCYVGRKDEINTIPLLQDIMKSGKRLGVPKCISYGLMEVYEITSLNNLQPGAYGILEPSEGCKKMAPEEIEFACVPCLTCNEKGARLGYGGGFYDRYLSKLSCPKAVLCRSRVMEQDIPVDEYDLRMEIVVTEEGAIGLPESLVSQK